jgi:hypothetical protein
MLLWSEALLPGRETRAIPVALKHAQQFISVVVADLIL